MSGQPLLAIENLKIADGRRALVEGVGFRLEAGEFAAFVGASGSGKTLTALAALGLLPPGLSAAGGSIRLRGRELLGLTRKEWRRIRGAEIAMIFQEPMTSLNPVMTAGAQISEAVRQHRRCSRREAWTAAVEALRSVRVPDAESRMKAYPHQLSGGLRQRVMIAMALSCSPALLIADEPTTALDVTVQAGVIRLLQKIRRVRNLTVLLITHDISLAVEAAERVIVISGSGTIEDRPSAEIVAGPEHPYTKQLIENCRRRRAAAR